MRSLPLAKQGGNDDRPKLPEGWDWAEWSGREKTILFWQTGLNATLQATFVARFAEIRVAAEANCLLGKSKAYDFRGGGKAKITHPNPGWRGWWFRDGDTRYVTHFTKGSTSDGDEEAEEATVATAREEHRSRKTKGQRE